MKRKGSNVDDISDVDILATTGPYLFTELYHTGRKEGLYTDVLHLMGDSDKPVLEHRHGGPDWHKFGKYCEHMLSHTWVKPERRDLQEYAEYGADATPSPPTPATPEVTPPPTPATPSTPTSPTEPSGTERDVSASSSAASSIFVVSVLVGATNVLAFA